MILGSTIILNCGTARLNYTIAAFYIQKKEWKLVEEFLAEEQSSVERSVQSIQRSIVNKDFNFKIFCIFAFISTKRSIVAFP